MGKLLFCLIAAIGFLLSSPAAASPGKIHPTVPSPGNPLKKSRAKRFLDGEILVRFKEGVTEDAKRLKHASHGAIKIKEFRRSGIHRVRLPRGRNLEKVVGEYNADPTVLHAEPNYLYSLDAVPNDPYFSYQYDLRNNGQNNGTPGADVKATEAWDLTTGSADVVIAVIDTGVDYSHPDLAGNIWSNPFEIPGNGVDDDNNGYIDDIHGIDARNNDSDPMDDHGHGTHVAGTIGAVGNNGVGVAGLNWEVSIMAFKFLGVDGVGSSSDAIECLEYIADMKARGVNIAATNNSWGGGPYSPFLRDAIAAQGDILFVAAAGNDGADDDQIPHYPASYDSLNVIAVASTDRNDALASTSCYGRRSVDVAAPGVSILSTLSSVNAFGLPDSYVFMGGTSMATPHVAGLAGLLWAQNPLFTWTEVRNLILSSGDEATSIQGKTVTGRRINAFEALTCSNKPIFSVLDDSSPIVIGVPSTLSVLSIDCEASVGPVEGIITDGGIPYAIYLFDDGLGLDAAANDGIFSGNWTPLTGNVELFFSSPAGSEVVVPSPGNLVISPDSLGNGYVDIFYEEQLIVDNGICPCDWSISSGSLPPGLSFDSGGWIYGYPSQFGSFPFSVAVEDWTNDVGSKNYTVTVDILADIDNDGILDSQEDKNGDGIIDPEAGETDPSNPDSDADGIFDGTEIGLTAPQHPAATDLGAGFFVPDQDPSTATDPNNPDSDWDGVADGVEDSNRNGAVNPGETDPLDPSCSCDFDLDGDVDGSDLVKLRQDLGRTDCAEDCPADVDLDSDVDVFDMAVFEKELGRIICPSSAP